MDGVDVSVVICTKDRPEMLRRCLTSLVTGSRLPAEILVMDQSANGRTDRIVRELSSSHPQVVLRYFKLQQAGLTAARNAGVKASRCGVVAFTDDDCIADSNWIDAIAREFTVNGANCVCGRTCAADHSDRPRQALISTLTAHRRERVCGKRNPVMVGRGNNMAFRRSDLLKLGGFNEHIGVGTRLFAGDDLDVFYRLLRAGGTIARVPDAVILHSQPEDWQSVLKKKRGYAISAAALLSGRFRYGDAYAGLLLIGKMAYEFGYLMCGGVIRGNRQVAQVGLHSFLGTLSGLKYALNPGFTQEVRAMTQYACGSYAHGDGKSSAHETTDVVNTPAEQGQNVSLD